ncbi:DMT family transporter [bacterium]|nr:DMT family transporter [bacterium]
MENKVKALINITLGALSFALMAVMIKLAAGIPVFQQICFRNTIGAIFTIIIAKKTGVSLLGSRKNIKPLLGRAFFGLLAMICYFYAVSNLVLADAAMLNRLAPFFVAVFAYVFLHEKLSKIHIPVLLVVFAGALMIIKPRFDISVLPGVIALCSAVFSGVAHTLVRYLGKRESPVTVVFYFNVFPLVLLIPLVAFTFVLPNLIQTLALVGIGVFALLGQLFVTNAYRYAPAAEVSLYTYIMVIFSAFFGFAFWGEHPDVLSAIGTVIIIACAGVIYWYNPKK